MDLKLGKQMRSMGGVHTRSVDSERPLSEFEKITPLSPMAVFTALRFAIYHKKLICLNKVDFSTLF
jgi:hypothetical protein